jgi:hypothetical protein
MLVMPSGKHVRRKCACNTGLFVFAQAMRSMSGDDVANTLILGMEEWKRFGDSVPKLFHP